MFFSFKINKLFLSVAIVALTVIMCMFAVSGKVIESEEADSQETETKTISLAVIMYHGLIRDESLQNTYMISPDLFENDLKYLKDNGYNTIVIQDLLDYFEKGTPLPDNPVMLTFDDGYYNNYYYAYPLLQKYNSKAIISPIGYTADAEQGTGDKNPAYSQCDWNEYKEMVESGLVEIQNHTFNLHKNINGRKGASIKSGENYEEYHSILVEDLEKFNQRMYEELGIKPTAFTYPFGAKSEETLKIIKEMGFKAALDCEEKLNEISTEEDLYEIHRFLRPNNMSTSDFFENKVNIGSTRTE